MGRCRVTVRISVNKLLLHRKFEANLSSNERRCSEDQSRRRNSHERLQLNYTTGRNSRLAAQALGNVPELTRISQREIHGAVLSSTRARRQTLRSMPTAKPTLH
jgi:hypothetical protein